jgi:hypothetical protein
MISGARLRRGFHRIGLGCAVPLAVLAVLLGLFASAVAIAIRAGVEGMSFDLVNAAFTSAGVAAECAIAGISIYGFCRALGWIISGFLKD